MRNYFSSFELKTPTSLLGISDQGGYITNWKVKNSSGEWVDVLYVGTELKRTGIPILFPYYGPSESGMGQHGFGRNLKWKAVDSSETEATLELTDGDLPEETKKLYPFQFKSQITIKLHADSFEYILNVQNRGQAPMPVAPGLHPYWAVDHDKKASVKIEGYVMDPRLRGETAGVKEFDAAKIDWDTAPPDEEYEFRNPVTINFPDKKVTLEDHSDKISKLVVWSQPVSAPNHDFICFEPVTQKRGTYDKNPILITSGKSWSLDLSFSVSLLS